jgi:hypothetical protein
MAPIPVQASIGLPVDVEPPFAQVSQLSPLPAPGQTRYGRAGDYGWLVGEVEQSYRGPRLRYAPVDQVDPYGGSVTLLRDSLVDGLKDGQVVRVRGHLLNPDNRAPAPPYKVLSVELVQP